MPAVERMICSVNVRAGKEREYSIDPTNEPKKVYIVGGGPAGMEAARIAAQRGHQVTLFDRNERLGGKLPLVAQIPYKEEIKKITEYLSKQLEKSSVRIELGKEVNAEFIIKSEVDAVIIATGAEHVIPEILGIKEGNVITAINAMADSGIKEAEEVVIVGGNAIGCDTAICLAKIGKKVTILEMQEKLATGIGPAMRWVTLQRARELGVVTKVMTKVKEITKDGVLAETQDRSLRFFEADAVVLATGMKPSDTLVKELKNKVASLYAIGDCVEPRQIHEAILEGLCVAREI
jgi:pyruvate/2-oxoglutarate dehydrogenase complex dihydrolipoamide dehydrogenase (E3) component